MSFTKLRSLQSRKHSTQISKAMNQRLSCVSDYVLLSQCSDRLINELLKDTGDLLEFDFKQRKHFIVLLEQLVHFLDKDGLAEGLGVVQDYEFYG